MPTNHPARIYFLLAREMNKAIVFRRGPTKWTQMIVWDLNSDELEYGQWSKVKFQKWRCDLSPSGKYLIYMDDQFENGDSSIVISKPPYWRALTKWIYPYPAFNGSGIFKTENTLVLNTDYMPQNHDFFPIPDQLNIIQNKSFDLETVRLKRDGWSSLDTKEFIDNRIKGLNEPSIFWNDIYKFWKDLLCGKVFQSTPELWVKSITKSSFLYRISYYHYEQHKRLSKFFIKVKNKLRELEHVEWADVDHNGRIVASKNGTLVASKRSKGNFQLGTIEVVHDLNYLKPEKVIVPDEMKKW